MKICTKCKLELPLERFTVKKGRPGHKNYYRSQCKDCVNEIHRAKYNKVKRDRTKPKRKPKPLTKKTCTDCGKTKSLDKFHTSCKNPSSLWHWGSQCKPCAAAYRRRRHKEGYRRPDPDLALYLLEHKLKGVKQNKFYGGSRTKTTLEFILTVDDIRKLIAKQTKDGHLLCAATGVPLIIEVGAKQLLSPSIDRIDNSKGYNADNVRLVALFYNLGRNKWPDDEAMGAVRTIASHFKNKV